jgi:tetratricopeptide (TPR) repeat protein
MIARVTVVIALASSAVASADSTTAKAEFAAGQSLFKAGDFLGAAKRFQTAYAEDPDPVYLFNVAQAFRLAKSCTQARDFYRKFLAAAPSAPNREKVKRYLAEVEACATSEVEETPPVEPPPPPRETPPPPPEPVDTGKTRRRLGIASIALGVIATGTGAVFVRRVGNLERDREALCPAPCTWSADLAAREAALQRDGDRASGLAIGAFAVGGVALAGGIVLYLTGRNAERVTVVPTRGGGIATARFEF